FGGLLHSLLSWKVMLPAALLVGWTAGTVLVLRAVGLWDVTDAKTTLVWLLLAGLPLVYSGIEASSKNNHWWTAARVQFKAVAFIEVVRDSHSFSLPIELLLFPLLLGLTVLSAAADDRQDLKTARRLVDFVLVSAGLILLLVALRDVFVHFDES